MADELDRTQFEELYVEFTKKHWPRYLQPDAIADEEIGDGQVWRWDEDEGVNRPASLSAGHTEDHDHDGLPTQKLLADNTHEGTPAPGAHHDPGDEHAESHSHVSHTGINPADHHSPANDHAAGSDPNDHTRLHDLLEPLDHGDTAFTRAAARGQLIVGVDGSPDLWDRLIGGAVGTYARWNGDDLLPSVIPARDPLGGGAVIGNAFEELATFTLSLDIVIVSGPYPVLVDTNAKSVWVYCSVNTGSVLGKAVIYDETAGNEPQALIAESNEVTISNTTVAWVEFPFATPPTLTVGTNYFIGFHVDGGGGGTPNVLLRFSNASINRASTLGLITYRDVITYPGAPDPWLIASDTPDGTQLIAAYIEPAPAVGSGFPLTGPWTFRTDTGSSPTSGRLTMDNVVTASVTNVYANVLDSDTHDRTLMFDQLADGDNVWIWEAAEVANIAQFTVNGTPSVSAGVWTIPVTYVADAGTTPWSQNTSIRLGFLAGAGGAGHVEDHDHDGAPTQQLLAANTHGTPSPTTHHDNSSDHVAGTDPNDHAPTDDHLEAHDVPSHTGTPGGELGGTWTSPTVDGTHSGSAHHVAGSDPNDHAESHDVPSHTGTPGGQLGGTWTSPTVDASHSGSAHHAEAHGHMNIFEFSGQGEDAAVETMLPKSHYIGESADRGTLTLVRFKVWLGVAGVTGTLTVKLYRMVGSLLTDTEIEIASVDITTGSIGEDATVATLSTNEHIRAKITAIHSGTPAKDVNCALVVTQGVK